MWRLLGTSPAVLMPKRLAMDERPWSELSISPSISDDFTTSKAASVASSLAENGFVVWLLEKDRYATKRAFNRQMLIRIQNFQFSTSAPIWVAAIFISLNMLVIIFLI